MDSKILAASLGSGFAIGLTLMLTATFSFLPGSYIMNRFIYYNPIMRLLMGGFVGLGSIFSFIFIGGMILLGRMKPVHYFGLAPILRVGTPIAPKGWLSSIFTIFNVLLHPILMKMETGEDAKGYEAAANTLLLKGEPTTVTYDVGGKQGKTEFVPGAVCEWFFHQARVAGFLKRTDWQRRMTELESSGIGVEMTKQATALVS